MSTLPTLPVGDDEVTTDEKALLIELETQSDGRASSNGEARLASTSRRYSSEMEEPEEVVPRLQGEFEPTDSGVYDDCRLESQEIVVEEAAARRVIEPEAVTRIPPPQQVKEKWPRDEQMDSGMISDADLHMISAS
jgi:hypothetical protein